jgi:hypothetical protein
MRPGRSSHGNGGILLQAPGRCDKLRVMKTTRRLLNFRS